MPENKNQHYVPELYFKLFSDDGRYINLFNLKRRKTIPSVSIKDQCSEDYFYGKGPGQDGKLTIEGSFALLEHTVAKIIHSILETQQVPIKRSKQYFELLFYIVSQHNRTKHEADEADEITDQMARVWLQKNETLSSILKNVRIGLKNPTAFGLYSAATSWPLALDLEAKLICNESREAFVFSDHPVVYYNQYMESRDERSFVGLAARGLQIFFPLSPSCLLHLYDGGVYRVGSEKHTCCKIYDAAEVRKLNELQWVNALENVYYSSSSTEDSIRSQAKRALPRRHTNLAVVKQTPYASEPNSSLLEMRGVDLKIRLRPCFVTIKKSMQGIPLFKRQLYRDPILVKLLDAFYEQVEAGNYRDQDFLKFLADVASLRT
jgi:hypothetical protein